MTLITAPASFLAVMTEGDVWFERTDFETRSIFNKKRQVISYASASHWRVSMRTAPRRTDEAGEWRRFVMQLRGRENWFAFPMPLYPGPQTGYAGAAKVDGADQSGFSLLLKGLTPGADILAAGDFFTVVNQCLMTDADVTADGSGEAEVSFDAPLRTSPADEADLELAAPYFLCASSTSGAAKWSGSPVSRSTFTFAGAEHF